MRRPSNRWHPLRPFGHGQSGPSRPSHDALTTLVWQYVRTRALTPDEATRRTAIEARNWLTSAALCRSIGDRFRGRESLDIDANTLLEIEVGTIANISLTASDSY